MATTRDSLELFGAELLPKPALLSQWSYCWWSGYWYGPWPVGAMLGILAGLIVGACIEL